MTQFTLEQALHLGIQQQQSGNLPQAEFIYRQILAADPDQPDAIHFLGTIAFQRGEFDQAITLMERSLALFPNAPHTLYNLANAYQSAGRIDDAFARFHDTLSLSPDFANAWNNLAVLHKSIGQIEPAVAAFRKLIALQPTNSAAYSNLLLTLHYDPRSTLDSLRVEHALWYQAYARLLSHLIQPLANDKSPHRKLRLGYISPDFLSHAVGRNILPLFRHHNHDQFHITCYANVPQPDAFTSAFQSLSDQWRNTLSLTPEQIAQQIRADKIDILIDLALHSANNQLLVLAQKPAPIQCTFAGYPSTTGLPNIDYRLTDPHLDPPSPSRDAFYSEQSLRLPDSFWCYDPLTTGPSVNPLPALTNHFITFGCLNNPCKINDHVLTLWAQLLAKNPEAHILLLSPIGNHRRHIEKMLNIDPSRIHFVSNSPREQYLAQYHRIDIALDTFPYNGHTTTLDALWMGVPVITLAGDHPVSRAALSQLTNLNLPELIARTPEQFISIATTLANNLPQLQTLRDTLRPRMAASPLMNAESFTKNIEAAYLHAWQTYYSSPLTPS